MKHGEIINLGSHRLMCGDATNPDHVKELLKDDVPSLCVTDPPYGVNYDPAKTKSSKYNKILNDNNFVWLEFINYFPGNVLYLWHAYLQSGKIISSLENYGFEIKAQIIWNKHHFRLGKSHYHWKHEPCIYAIKKGKSGNWQGSRKESTVWDIHSLNSYGKKEKRFSHPTQKPLECMRRPILHNSAPGEGIYDPFGGSGTTLIAAQETGRKCLMIEWESEYCDLIIQRYNEFVRQSDMLVQDAI